MILYMRYKEYLFSKLLQNLIRFVLPV